VTTRDRHLPTPLAAPTAAPATATAGTATATAGTATTRGEVIATAGTVATSAGTAATTTGTAATTTGTAAATAGTITAPGRPPRRTYLELEALANAVPGARRHVRDTLARWDLGEVSDDVELVTCELLTNAVSASAVLPFRASVGLLVTACPGRLVTLVWDASLQPPVPADPDDDAAGGRGLAIVEALSTRWGWVPDERGKIVWAMLDLGYPCPSAAGPCRLTS
jgi:anti-sigma regulatory factor (Ser/Thr protein kinase)